MKTKTSNQFLISGPTQLIDTDPKTNKLQKRQDGTQNFEHAGHNNKGLKRRNLVR